MPAVLSKDELLTALKRAARDHGMHCHPVDLESLRAELESTRARWILGGRKVTYYLSCRLDEPSRTMRFRETVAEETWGLPMPLLWGEEQKETVMTDIGPIEYHRIRHQIEQVVRTAGWSFSFERGQRP
jgi:hypothetical protein